MKKTIWILLLCFSGWAYSQATTSLSATATPTTGKTNKMPLIVGGVLEAGSGVLANGDHGTGLVRVTPLIGAWLNGLGYLRLGYGLYSYVQEPEDGEKREIDHRDFSAQLGISLGFGPYLQGSYTRAKNLSDAGDVVWNEYGFGLGTFFTLGPKSALVFEIEYRFISEHYDPFENETVSGTRLQMNIGFVVYVY